MCYNKFNERRNKMKNISGSIADMLWTQGIIQKDDIDKCKYGIDIFFSSFIEIFSILLISIFVGNFVETLLLFVAFIPLRIYAGGYHADTKMKCYLISLGMYGIFFAISKYIPDSMYQTINVFCTIFSLIVVLMKAPVIHFNKKINSIERKYYRKFSIEICLIETVVILLLTTAFPKSEMILSLTVGQISVAVSMLAAIIKNILLKNKIV